MGAPRVGSLLDFTGKVALVTGAGSGAGSGIAASRAASRVAAVDVVSGRAGDCVAEDRALRGRDPGLAVLDVLRMDSELITDRVRRSTIPRPSLPRTVILTT